MTTTRKDIRRTDSFITYGTRGEQFTADVWRSDGMVVYGLADTQIAAFTDVLQELKKQRKELKRAIRAVRWLRFSHFLKKVFRRKR